MVVARGEIKHDVAARMRLRLAMPGLNERAEDVPLLLRHMLARVAIERVAVAHVVADVGDGDDEAEALAGALAVHGVVEVPRRFAVDGHQGQMGDVDAILAVGGAYFVL